VLLYTSIVSAIIQAPNNIICFTDRDFCTIENFVDQTGKTLLVEVNRNGAIIGSALGTVSGNDIAFEINHPGTLCWGDGTNLKVTPDLKAGDLITIKDGALLLGDMTIQDGFITSYSLSGTTLTITGFVASSVVASNIEVRIVNPLLRDTTVDKQQVNAITGPLTPDVGYSSGLEITGNTFKATFVFDNQQSANIAGSGEGMSLNMWQETAQNGNPQGLTVSEYGVIGGPWAASCPPSPENLVTPVINAVAVFDNLIKWSPAQDVIGAPATTGVSVNVLRGNQVYGYRTPKTDNQVVFDLTPLVAGDIIEIRSMIGTKMSDSLVTTYQPQDIVPTIVSIPSNDAVNEVQTELVILQSNTNQIVYTLDGSPVLDTFNKISPTAILYYTPIHVTGPFTLRAVSFDHSGKFSTQLVGNFAPANVLPQPITVTPQTNIANGAISISWTKPDDPTIDCFGVEIFTADGVKVGTTRIVFSTTLIITDLVPGTSYQFSVMTKNTGGFSEPSPKTLAVIFPQPTDIITILTANYRANKRFRITGTGSEVATVTLYSSNADGTIGSIIFRRGTTTPISAPVICTLTCTFTMDVRNAAVPSTNPGRIYVKSSLGGIDGPFTV
jgi:hypothetical protein